jgi:hypothetical protein
MLAKFADDYSVNWRQQTISLIQTDLDMYARVPGQSPQPEATVDESVSTVQTQMSPMGPSSSS